MIDLHTHTTTSDGTDTPEQLIRNAVAAGIGTIAVTDHDTFEGVSAALTEARKINAEEGLRRITVIPGVEFSTRYQGKDVHVLGYDIPLDDVYLTETLDNQNYIRMARDLKMIKKMNDAGIPITMEELTGGRLNTTITRANYGKWLFEHGYAESVNDAFDRLIGRGCPYYVGKEHMLPVEAVRHIKASGGVPFLAHPGLTKLPEETLMTMIEEMCREGLVGIEVYHSDHTPEHVEMALRLADHFHLEISRGTDYHGTTKPRIALGLGRNNLPDIELPPSLQERLRAPFYEKQ